MNIEIGTKIVVHAWEKFPEKVMTCVGYKYDERYKTNRYVLDNGTEWTESNLCSNFQLWQARNGYHIVDPE